MPSKKYLTVEKYHADFPKDIRDRLDTFRELIKKAVPDLTEAISYNMPAFKQNSTVVYYAAFKKHISLFPAPGGKEWEKDFKPYKISGRGTIQFSYDQPIPTVLITRIVKHLANKDAEKKKQ